MTNRRLALERCLIAGLGCALPALVHGQAPGISGQGTTAAGTRLSQPDAAAGIRAALERGAGAAIGKLGIADGFWKNDKVRIPLPDKLRQLRSAAGLFGMEQQFAELELTMNRAAEAAVPQARDILVATIRQMKPQDALAIVRGGDTAVTDYFRTNSADRIMQRFAPIVSAATARIGLKRRYDDLMGKAAQFGLVGAADASLDGYVTRRAVDGLFTMIALEEREIRADPIGTGSQILRRVFGR